jgi:hypothetical protein
MVLSVIPFPIVESSGKVIDPFHCILYKVMLAVLAVQFGTPRGRCDEHIDKFPLIMKPRFNLPVGERNHF